MSARSRVIEKTGHASRIKTGSRRAGSCVPMGSLTTPTEFLRPTMVPDERLHLTQRTELHTVHYLTQVCGRCSRSVLRWDKFLRPQTTFLEFSPATAWARVITTNSRDCHAVLRCFLWHGRPECPTFAIIAKCVSDHGHQHLSANASRFQSQPSGSSPVYKSAARVDPPEHQEPMS